MSFSLHADANTHTIGEVMVSYAKTNLTSDYTKLSSYRVFNKNNGVFTENDDFSTYTPRGY